MPKQRNVDLGPWNKGICNTARAYAVPKGAVLDAMNVDFTDEGHAIRREGRTRTVALEVAHSLANAGGKAFICQNSELGMITSVSPLVITPLRTALSEGRISYAERGGEVWWSNGTDSGRCNADNTDHPWVVPTPSDIIGVYAGVGTLTPGDYRLAITQVNAYGEESVAAPIQVFTLGVVGSIIIDLPAASSGVDHFNVYCTVANGKVLQKYGTAAAGETSTTIEEFPTGKQIKARAFLSPMPAGEALEFHGARLCVLKGQFLFFSEPYDYGVYDPAQNYIVLGTTGSVIASVESGMFVVADRTWFYQGEDIKTAVPMEKLSFGAAKGTCFTPPLSTNPNVGWYSDRGVVIGSSDGSLVTLQRDIGFSSPIAESGAAWMRHRDGMLHVVVSLDATATYSERVSSAFTASRVRYNDDATTMSVNLTTGATARYAEFNLNSFANIDGVEYGCDSTALYSLLGDDDVGVNIQAYIDFGHIGYESLQIKAPHVVYVAGKSSSPMVVTITLPDGNAYDYPALDFSENMECVQRHGEMRGLINARQSYFDTVVRNEDGAAMEVFAVSVVVDESNRRI